MADMLRAEGMAIESYNVGACHQNYEPMYLDEILQKGRKD
jgi:hypothetical protein